MKPFEKLPIEKQARIVNASISEFAEKDYETASMNKVVERAGIAKGSLFNYFKSKSSLYNHIYQLALGEVKAYLRTVRDETAEQPFDVRMANIVDSGIQFITQHPRLARIYFRLIYSGDSPHRKKVTNELQSMSDKYLGGIIQDAMDRNELDAQLDKSQAVFFLDSVMNRFLKDYHETLELGKNDRFDKEKWVKGITEFFTKGLSS
jgi:AcrR family transcriptional regulator